MNRARQVTREGLELGGYRVLAADGPLSVDEIARDQTKQSDLLLTDVLTPGMNPDINLWGANFSCSAEKPMLR